MLFSTGVVLISNNFYFFGLLTFLSFCTYIFINIKNIKLLKPFGGYANWITFFRLLLLLYVTTKFQTLSFTSIVSVLILNIILDIVDGIVARYFKTESIFGLYFDMELDAFYVCLASLILYTANLTGSWIIWIGILRYLYTFLMVILNINIKSEPKQKFASLVAGTLFWCLLIPFINTKFNFILMLVSALVFVSFIKSFVYQLNNSY